MNDERALEQVAARLGEVRQLADEQISRIDSLLAQVGGLREEMKLREEIARREDEQ